MSTDVLVSYAHQHIHVRHPPSARRCGPHAPESAWHRAAYHVPHLIAWTIVELGGHIEHRRDYVGVAGTGLYTSTWEPTISVRSRGRRTPGDGFRVLVSRGRPTERAELRGGCQQIYRGHRE